MNTKIIIVLVILLVVVEAGIVGFLVYLRNNAPSEEEQKKLTEDACGPLTENGGGPDMLGPSTARSKNIDDASIKGSLSGVRAHAEIYFDVQNSYGSKTARAERSFEACSLSDTIFDKNDLRSVFQMFAVAERACEPAERWVATCALGAASALDGNSGFNSDVTGMPLPIRAQSYAISVPLKTGGSWCVDSAGASRMGKAEGGGDELARCSGVGPEPARPPVRAYPSETSVINVDMDGVEMEDQ